MVTRIVDLLVDRGYREIVTYSFIDAASDRDYSAGHPGLTLKNPISSDLSVMRQSLWPGLVSTYTANAARQRTRMRLFEHGALFDNSSGEVVETPVLSGLMQRARLWPSSGARRTMWSISST